MDHATLDFRSVLVRSEHNWLLEVLFVSSFWMWEWRITRESYVSEGQEFNVSSSTAGR